MIRVLEPELERVDIGDTVYYYTVLGNNRHSIHLWIHPFCVSRAWVSPQETIPILAAGTEGMLLYEADNEFKICPPATRWIVIVYHSCEHGQSTLTVLTPDVKTVKFQEGAILSVPQKYNEVMIRLERTNNHHEMIIAKVRNDGLIKIEEVK